MPQVPRFRTAQELLRWLVDTVEQGDPVVVSYSWYYRHVMGRDWEHWSQAYAQSAARHGRNSPGIQLTGLGRVHLDTFIVSAGNRTPSRGHWRTAPYTERDWHGLFGAARLLH
jgi:hypothetical protein